MKNSFSYLNGLIWLSSIIVIIIFGFFSYGVHQSYFTHKKKENQAFCGVPDVHYSDNAIDGKRLFQHNCASCHNKNMTDDMTGPALAGVEQRWANYPKEDLYNYIRKSTLMLDEKHPKAVELFEAWNGAVMTSFPNLTDEEIEAILEYVNVIYYSQEKESESQIISCSF